MNRIRDLRIEKGWNQEYLGSLLNVQKSAVSKYEQGKISLNDDIIKKLSEIFEVSSDYLIGNSDIKNPEKTEITLTDKDEKDIAKTMQKLKEQLSGDQGLMFDGDILDEETAKLLLAAIEQQERMIKKINKKYTPKKYRK